MLKFARTPFVVLLFLSVLLSACGAAPSTTAPASTAAIAASASTGSDALPNAVTADSTTVKVASLPYISFAPFFIADEEGFFKAQGLNVEFVTFTGQNEILPALTAGQVDVGGGLLSAGALNTIKKGGGIRIVADKGYIDPQGCANIGLVARKEVAPNGPAMTADQLRGRTLAHLRGSWLDFYASKVFRSVGLTMDDMNVVTIPIASTLEAMSSKQIDLALNNEPWITRMVQAGNVAVLTPVQELMPDSQSAITLYGPSLLDKNSDVGNRFMVAYLQAVRKYNEGKTDRNVEILAKAIKLDPALIKDMCWPALRADGSLNTASVQEFQEWAVSGKDLDAVVPEAEYWDGSFVEFANKQLEAAQ